ncbi:MAG: DUF456 domain-containing protein [Marinobacter sp.]|nr:DUF456 domain-containing protein [Marinobacter sp.]
MDALTLLLWLLAILLVLLGLAGSVLPLIPGVPLIFLGLVVAAWAEGFVHVGGWTLAALGILTLASLVVDFAATAVSTKRFGAGRAAIIGATLGLLIGLFLGLPGMILGPFIGAVGGHLLAQGTLPDSARAGVGAWVGLLLGTLAKLVIGILMVIVFATVYLLGGAG